MSNVAAKIQALLPELQREVEDFVDFLQSKYARRKKEEMKLEWRGACRSEGRVHLC